MKRFLPYITSVTLLTLMVMVLPMHQAHAFDAFGVDIGAWIAEGLANIFYTVQTIISWVLALSGALLNFSINLTLHIREFVDSTPAIYIVWKSIRDISGMFIIFTLLYAAIKLILGLGTKFGDLIKNIVIAGVLINFSFFFAGLGIDVSNVVSMQLYNAIAPANSLSTEAMNPGKVQELFKDGGLSDIFMKQLKITSFYDTSGSLSKTAQNGGVFSLPIQVIIQGVTAIIIMVTATFSFFFAGIAFIIRFVMLLFLLAFSPIWFASHIVPGLKEYADKWTKNYKNLLLFMPVYLLLMYFALYIMTSSPFLKLKDNMAGASDWSGILLTLTVNGVLVIIMINAPLLAALSFGSAATGWFDEKKFGAMGISKWMGGWVGTRTVGRAAGAADKALGNTRIGNSQFVRDIRASTTGSLANSKMGYSRSSTEQGTAAKDVAKRRREIDRNIAVTALANSGSGDAAAFKTHLSLMSEAEKLALDPKILKNPEVLRLLKKTDFDAIKKSEAISDADKREISDKRKEALIESVQAASVDDKHKKAVKNMLKNMDTDDLIDLGDELTKDNLIEGLTIQQLKSMSESGLAASKKHEIGERISNWSGRHGGEEHAAAGWIARNKREWLSGSHDDGGRSTADEL